MVPSAPSARIGPAESRSSSGWVIEELRVGIELQLHNSTRRPSGEACERVASRRRERLSSETRCGVGVVPTPHQGNERVLGFGRAEAGISYADASFSFAGELS